MNEFPKVITTFYDSNLGKVRVVQLIDSDFSNIKMERSVKDSMKESSWVLLDDDDQACLMDRALIEMSKDKAVVSRHLENANKHIQSLSDNQAKTNLEVAAEKIDQADDFDNSPVDAPDEPEVSDEPFDNFPRF